MAFQSWEKLLMWKPRHLYYNNNNSNNNVTVQLIKIQLKCISRRRQIF